MADGSGEVCENCLPILTALRDELRGQRELTNAAARKVGQARREDPSKKLRDHADWDRGARLYRLWQRQTGRTRSRFTVLRFKKCLPYLQEYEDEILVRAIMGLAHSPSLGDPDANGIREKFNWWQTLFNPEKPDNIERYANKAPMAWKETLEEHMAEVEARR